MSTPLPPPRPSEADGLNPVLEDLLSRWAATAVARDQQGGHAAEERAALRASGLLDLTRPSAFGGQGVSWTGFYRVLARMAEVDSALAHLFAFHHLQLATVRIYGTPAQQAALLRDPPGRTRFWGNALNPLDRRTVARREGSGWVLDGSKRYCSGSVGADWLIVSGWQTEPEGLLIAALPATRAGVHVQEDWDAFGQKQTDSGSIRFEGVWVAADEVLVAPGAPLSDWQTLRALISQLILTHLYLGLARGALAEGRRYLREQARPWFSAGVAQAIDDPIVQHRHGELHLKLRAAEAVAAEAVAALEAAWAQGEALDAAGRGAVAVATAEAKVLAHRASVEIASQIFELTGAGATSRRLGLDRYWRNARVHTLHDPIDQKLRDLGRHALASRWPEPTPYG